MSHQLIEALIIPAMSAFVTAVMVGVSLLIARREAKESAKASLLATELPDRTMRRAS